VRALWAAALAAGVACGNGQGARGPARAPAGAATGEHAAVVWRVAGAAPGRGPDGLLVRGAAGELAELDPRSGRTLRALRLGRLEVDAALSSRELLVARGDGPWLVGLDPASGAARWRHRCTNAETPCDLAGGRAGDRLIVLGTIEHRSPTWSIGLVALDAATGRERWRRPTRWSDRAGTAVVVDGARAFVLGPDRALAVAADGRLLWERARHAALASGPAALAAGGGRVAFSDRGGVRIVDGAHGRDVAWAAAGGAPALALAGDLLLAAGEDGALAAFDAATGRARWRVRPADRLVPPILTDDRTIYVRTAHAGEPVGPGEAAGVIALRRADGAERWRYPLGINRSIVLAAGLVIADRTADDAREVVALAASLAPPGRATVRGTVRAAAGLPPLELGGLRVRIGDTVVATDAAGRFAATIPAAGVATIALMDRPRGVAPPPSCVGARPVRLRAERAITYQTEIVIELTIPCPPV
jgi:outer membrane protein assembly factor BamB